MAVKLRLARFGKRGQPLYRLVAVDEHKKRNGKTIEDLGLYDPHKTEGKVNIKIDRVKYWVSVGATPTSTVSSLLSKSL